MYCINMKSNGQPCGDPCRIRRYIFDGAAEGYDRSSVHFVKKIRITESDLKKYVKVQNYLTNQHLNDNIDVSNII